ncbi:MAG: MBL fold metallo-hydrolase [bacterium]|nr:MBL fold metallo-hydrolase [bacterium]
MEHHEPNTSILSFHGGVGMVTGANFMLKNSTRTLLVDCGLIQGPHGAEIQNWEPFAYDPKAIDTLFVTHSHIDHIGRIPKLVREGFRGRIVSTLETRALASLMLEDAEALLAREAKRYGKEPLYEKENIAEALSLWQTHPYGERYPLGDGESVTLRDAGHILGSAMIEYERGGRKVLFTGDLGNTPTPLLRDTEKITDISYLVMESVYGDTNHESSEERRAKLEAVVERAIARGGALIIPAFSLERTQVILYELNNLVEEGKIPSVPVFLDSPLAIRITDVYKNAKKLFNSHVQSEISGGDDIFNFPKLKFTVATEESKDIVHTKNPKIIIAGSGMSNGGRIIHHEIEYLPDPRSTILLVGYQSIGTQGRMIADGTKELRINGRVIRVNADVEIIRGFSSHKDSDHLIEFVSNTKKTLKTAFVVMGEPKASLFLVQRLRDYLGVTAVYPKLGESVEIAI